MAGEWPLVGRDGELSLLFGLVRSDERRGVVLAGPAGVGKTRLATEYLAEAERSGLPTARAAATHSAADLPQLVLGAVASGALTHDGGLWHLTGPLTPSDRLVELVEARLGNLADAERSLLELVAIGEPLGTTELCTLADPALAESLERKVLLARRRRRNHRRPPPGRHPPGWRLDGGGQVRGEVM